jgi:anaerobic selenocysteine-containing dehydrogenase
MKQVVNAACPHDCPDACGVLITVENGRAMRIQGDPAHPVTRGFLCAKVAKYLDRVYSPGRVLYPLRRVKPKGPAKAAGAILHDGQDDAFVRISWDEALDEIVTRFGQIAGEFGPEAILPFSYGGTLGALNNASMDRRFFHRLGASQLDRTICSTAGEAGLIAVLGGKIGTEPEQFRHSQFILVWGTNVHANNVHLWPFIEEARRKGGKLIVIDPYLTRTARCADWYLPIHPGTDLALALAMMHVIIRENLHDSDYVARHTHGFDRLREHVETCTPEWAARWTGISAEDIRRLAREYATARPAAIRLGYGVQRGENGGQAIRGICMLPCLTGSWKEVGGGLQLSTSALFPLDKAGLQRPDLMQQALGRPARVINMVELGSVLEKLADPPVKALFVYNCNPAAVCPDHNAVVKGLSRPDLFTVVHEQFLTDTCDYADIVLPATTLFEHKDLQGSYGTYFLQVSQKAIEPLGESRSNFDVFAELARRMGFTESCFRESVDDAIDLALSTKHPRLAGIDRQRLEREGHARLNFAAAAAGAGLSQGEPPPAQTEANDAPFLPFANGNFDTPSGKAEFYSERLAAEGVDPLPVFRAPRESRHSGNKRFTLELLPRKPDNCLNSTFCNLPAHQTLEPEPRLEMNPLDAAARGISDGAPVRVYNDRGELVLPAKLDASVQAGIAVARLGWAKLAPGGVNVNVLTSQRLTDIGRGPTYYSTLVEVELSGGR